MEKSGALFIPAPCLASRSGCHHSPASCNLFYVSFQQQVPYSQPFFMSVLTLLKMSNTSKWYLHYDELPDDASSWSSAFDPPTDLPTIKKDKPAKSTKRLKGSKKKAKRKKAKKSKKKSKTSARSLATESEAASETHSSTTMGDPMMFHRPINFRSRACAKMLVRASLRCACHVMYVSHCPNTLSSRSSCM